MMIVLPTQARPGREARYAAYGLASLIFKRPKSSKFEKLDPGQRTSTSNGFDRDLLAFARATIEGRWVLRFPETLAILSSTLNGLSPLRFFRGVGLVAKTCRRR